MGQQNLNFERVNTVTVNPPPEPEQSMDDILKARFTPDDADSIKAFCRGRRITVSDYLRELASLDSGYFDLIKTLNKHKAYLIPLIDNL